MESGLQLAKVLELKTPPTPAPPPKEREISQKRLINKLNYINFQDGTILINLRHTRFNRTLTLHARPQPCLGGHLECTWTRSADIARAMQSHEFEDILIPDQLAPWRVVPEVLEMNEQGAIFLLPESGNQIGTRRVRRKTCEDITVDLFQNSAGFRGHLVDFTPVSFRVAITLSPPQNFYWMNAALPVQIHFRKDNTLLYAGECRIIKQNSSQTTRSLVLQPVNSAVPRYPNKEFRSTRMTLTPSPNIQFLHPITNQKIDLKVLNLSGTGFMVEEEEENATLLPGLIIPQMELSFAGIFRVPCKAQVVYRHLPGASSTASPVRCGLAILDMAVQDHVMLLSLLNQTRDSNSYMCNWVDMDHLFDFFFETGFIYPEKYIHIQANKKNFKDTYNKLYTKAPALARHFTYQDNSGIHGHMSMLRFYENTWLAHHHAANHTGKVKNAGLHVLNQINNFSNDSNSLSSIHLNFMLAYFRPENKFPQRIFGGVSKFMGDKKGCSVDHFTYSHIKQTTDINALSLPTGWELAEMSPEDLSELETFYEHHSGGLMITALDLEPELLDQEALINDYKLIGLKRKRQLASLKKDGHLKAFFMVNISDSCLNMSDLTNSIKVVVLDSDRLGESIMKIALNMLLRENAMQEAPTLIYPTSYAEESGLEYEKKYTMWILNMQHLDKYLKFFEKLMAKVN